MNLIAQWNLLVLFSLLLVSLAPIVQSHSEIVTPHDDDGGGCGRDSRLGVPTDAVGLLSGNKQFVMKMKATNASFITDAAAGAHQRTIYPFDAIPYAHTITDPSFMFLGCSDSRVSEGTIFNAQPGVLFADRNSVLLYALHHLGVSHVIVMGHYGCGGVSAAITSNMQSAHDAKGSMDRWIWLIRRLYLQSQRPEIVALRQKNRQFTVVPPPDKSDTGFRALVEETVKMNVKRILRSKAANVLEKKVKILGWVYDIATLGITDLEVTRTL
ncbi:hypothetical protein ONZ45_g17155 [Pleurotus djamor]|nr:hypothetical protein ONZ45_g17155 [Pleurotus djamor]